MSPTSLIIFPLFDPKDPTHYHYWLKLFDSIDQSKVRFLFESGIPSNQAYQYSHTQKVTLKPLNLIERFLHMYQAYSTGVRHIHIHYSYWTAILAIILKKATGITLSYWHCEKYQKKPQDAMLDYILSQVDIVVTGSNDIASQYQALYPKIKATQVIPNFVESIDTTAAKLDPQRTHILFAHRLVKRKGSKQLPYIIKGLLQTPGRRVHLIGTGPDEQILKKQLADYHASITWYGDIPPQKLASLFKAADLFIMPSESEGFPRVILEAMVYKIPFVATDVGNVRLIVSDTQLTYLVPPAQPDIFIHTCNQLLAQKDITQLLEDNLDKVNACYRLKHARAAFEGFLGSL